MSCGAKSKITTTKKVIGGDSEMYQFTARKKKKRHASACK